MNMPFFNQSQTFFWLLWLGGLVLLRAKDLALVGVLSKGYLIRRRSDPLSKDDLSKILMRRLALISLTKIEVVVLVRDHRLLAVKSVHEELDVVGTCGRLLGRAIGDRCQARQVEGSGRRDEESHQPPPSHPRLVLLLLS